ncbi:MAG: hypothetical protein WC614_05200 [bacterium]
MISKAIVKNTIKELLRTRQAVPIGIVSIGVVIAIVFIFKSVNYELFSTIVFLISVLFTVGIIDSDLADGKILTVLSKPVSYTQFFLSKVLGVISVGSIIIVIMMLSALIITSSAVNVNMDIKVWFVLPIAGIIAHILWTLISATLSTFIKGYSNITAIILFSILFGALTVIPNQTVHAIIEFINNYILPAPEACLNSFKESRVSLSGKLFHSLLYIALLSIIGPVILNHKELGRK